MKITDVTIEQYEWPRHRPIRNGKYTYVNLGLTLCRVHTESGMTGIGWLGGTASSRPHTVFRPLVEHFRTALVGENPFNYQRIWDSMWEPKIVGRRGMTTHVISAIDIALWDLLGKLTGQPLYRLLGGYRDRIPAYIAGGYYEEDKGIQGLVDEMEQNLALGAKAVKIKVGGVPMREDAERVRAVRETIGPDVKLMIDANNAYSASEAITFAKMVEEYDIYWFEEPVHVDDYRGSARVAKATPIPIATGENEYTRYGFRDLIEYEAVDILTPDAQLLGGVTEFMKVAALAETYNLPVAPHGAQEIHVHLACALPGALILEVYRDTVDPFRNELFVEPLRLDEDGCVRAPDKPGLGVSLNEELLAPYRIA